MSENIRTIQTLESLKSVSVYSDFTEKVTIFDNNREALLKAVSEDLKKAKDRDEFFLKIIKKQANLKKIPTNAGVDTFDLLHKRVKKLYAVISTYTTGVKHEDFKEKWKDFKGTIENEKKKSLNERYENWIKYLKDLEEVLSDKKYKKLVIKLYNKYIGGKVERRVLGFNKKVAIKELYTILGVVNAKDKQLFPMEKIVDVLATLKKEQRTEYYDATKRFFTRINKNFEKKSEDLSEKLNLKEIKNYHYLVDIIPLSKAAQNEKMKKIKDELKKV